MKTNKNMPVNKELYKHYLIDLVGILKAERDTLKEQYTELLKISEDHQKENGGLQAEILGMKAVLRKGFPCSLLLPEDE